MSTIRETCLLELGFQGATVAVLRPASLADVYAAAAAVPVPDSLGEDKAVNVAYQMAIEDAQVLYQIESLGALDPVPGVADLVAALDPDDMALLRKAADRLKKKLRQSKRDSSPIDAQNTSSSEPASV